MRNKLKFATSIAFLIVFLALQASAAVFSIGDIPSGIQAGRSDAVYGTYQTALADQAKSIQAELFNLEQKIHGLALLDSSNLLAMAEAIYVLENEIIKMQLSISGRSDLANSPFERAALLGYALHLYQSLRIYSERVFEDMVRFIDVKLPGPNGRQFRVDIVKPTVENTFYEPNYRQDNILSQSEQLKLYNEKVAEFTKGGGSFSEMYKLDRQLALNPNFKAKQVFRAEYVVRKDLSTWITEGNAGHILLAEGGQVQSAGQLLIVRAPTGEVLMLVISNASGSYKPDLVSTQYAAKQIAKTLRVPPERVLITKGEPLSTQAIKIYLKGMGIAKDDLKKRVAMFENSFDVRKITFSCQALF